MMEIKTYEKEITQSIKVDAIKLNKNRYLVRLVEHINTTRPRIKNVQGVVTRTNLDRMRSGQTYVCENYYIADQHLTQDIETFGYAIIEKYRNFDNKIFDYVEQGGAIADLFRIDHNHVFLDAYGETRRYGLRLDYIDARMNDFNYDLEKAVEILRKRDDIYFVQPNARCGSGIKAKFDKFYVSED